MTISIETSPRKLIKLNWGFLISLGLAVVELIAENLRSY